ncbi:hypothetical protein Rsub_03460 [Raphidocelis subcapitata]|uniref:Uncharacterized protein n=1 Tax=Raphidocelis subcapitata TaxID=307507 RepID=A0A2V0NS62_9CHLO|nr:hypothetical protein Rsub_03460 [Raphidocelis subcapitata]|eukprot:GBF90464.1 hypothetical protein Rsub_03460 [Raphidocelis subcapitata]
MRRTYPSARAAAACCLLLMAAAAADAARALQQQPTDLDWRGGGSPYSITGGGFAGYMAGMEGGADLASIEGVNAAVRGGVGPLIAAAGHEPASRNPQTGSYVAELPHTNSGYVDGDGTSYANSNAWDSSA